MDDLTRVRELYGEPPRDPFAKARVAARLRAGARRRFPWKFGLAALAVATGAVVVAPGMLPAEPGKAPTVLGQPVLLAAAAQAEKAPDGRYWHVKQKFTMRWAKEYGKPGSRYRLETSSIYETWTDKKGQTWHGSIRLPVRPTDEAAWKENGSPTSWGFPRPDKPTLLKGKGPRTFYIAEGRVSFAELEKLPTDPRQLTTWMNERLLANLNRPAAGQPPANITRVEDGSTAAMLVSLLYQFPVSPDVRAAAYRALAGMPTVKIVEGAGNEGTTIGFLLQEGRPTQARVIIDPETSMVKSYQITGMPGKGDRIETILASGWTDEKPAPPTVE
ncbi:CU044_5270 family protein [Nonomuraea sp. NPDC050394]|uniref:CU044_5270 family protein n=1 Tax=Nonomuraea sp. NPDC050394 TaxID=3364363 RepID=UPI0037AB4F9D